MMTQITLDPELCEKFKAAGDFAEVVDESGRILGTFQRNPKWGQQTATVAPTERDNKDAATKQAVDDILEALRSGPADEVLDAAEESVERRRNRPRKPRT